MQLFISRLAELDDTKPILVACETLAPYMYGVLEESTDDSELLSCHWLDLLHCLRMPASCVHTQHSQERSATMLLWVHSPLLLHIKDSDTCMCFVPKDVVSRPCLLII